MSLRKLTTCSLYAAVLVTLVGLLISEVSKRSALAATQGEAKTQNAKDQTAKKDAQSKDAQQPGDGDNSADTDGQPPASKPSADNKAQGAPAADSGMSRREALLAGLTIFVLAVFVGFEVITKVPPTLHTPLMSGSNAISGITLVGAILVAGKAFETFKFSTFLGMVAVALASINVIGGFLVTHRMLAMFKKR